jgi:hypothetical protein
MLAPSTCRKKPFLFWRSEMAFFVKDASDRSELSRAGLGWHGTGAWSPPPTVAVVAA